MTYLELRHLSSLQPVVCNCSPLKVEVSQCKPNRSLGFEGWVMGRGKPGPTGVGDPPRCEDAQSWSGRRGICDSCMDKQPDHLVELSGRSEPRFQSRTTYQNAYLSKMTRTSKHRSGCEQLDSASARTEGRQPIPQRRQSLPLSHATVLPGRLGAPVCCH